MKHRTIPRSSPEPTGDLPFFVVPRKYGKSYIRKLLELEGFVLDRITGSHHIFEREDIVFVVPTHRNRVKSVYVKRVIELIEGE